MTKPNGNYETNAHRAKVVAMLAELKEQYWQLGRLEPRAAAEAIGHGTVWDILYRDAGLQAELGAFIEHERQVGVAARRVAARVPAGEENKRAQLITFCLGVVSEPEGCMADKLRAVGLAAELLGLRKHVPVPPESGKDHVSERKAEELEDLYREYPALAAGHAIDDNTVLTVPTNGANGAQGKG